MISSDPNQSVVLRFWSPSSCAKAVRVGAELGVFFGPPMLWLGGAVPCAQACMKHGQATSSPADLPNDHLKQREPFFGSRFAS